MKLKYKTSDISLGETSFLDLCNNNIPLALPSTEVGEISERALLSSRAIIANCDLAPRMCTYAIMFSEKTKFTMLMFFFTKRE